nr:peritrophin-1-like [Penaeus vannamei]
MVITAQEPIIPPLQRWVSSHLASVSLRQKSFLLVVLAAAGVCLAQDGVPCDVAISDQCPAEDGQQPTYFPDPEDCASYCECSGGIAWHLECGPGTLWNDEKDLCDWADTVDCGLRPHPTEAPPVSSEEP